MEIIWAAPEEVRWDSFGVDAEVDDDSQDEPGVEAGCLDEPVDESGRERVVGLGEGSSAGAALICLNGTKSASGGSDGFVLSVRLGILCTSSGVSDGDGITRCVPWEALNFNRAPSLSSPKPVELL